MSTVDTLNAHEVLTKVDRCMARYRNPDDRKRLEATKRELKRLFELRAELTNSKLATMLSHLARTRVDEGRAALSRDRDMPEMERHELFGTLDTWDEVLTFTDVARLDGQITTISRTLDMYVDK